MSEAETRLHEIPLDRAHDPREEAEPFQRLPEAMKEELIEKGRMVTGHVVLPVACDNMSGDALNEYGQQIEQADVLLIMTCAFGVQTIAKQMKKIVVPALDTLFIGKETGVGKFDEICTQCGACIIGETGGVCPVTSCHKGLVNGPCGGTNEGMCEIDKNKDCAWTLIYNRLKDLDRLDAMRKLQKPRDHHLISQSYIKRPFSPNW